MPKLALTKRLCWRLLTLRAALIFILFSSLLSAYVYLQSRPSYELYKALNATEINQSEDWIKNTVHNSSKFVFFKQLRGAGFNNQAQEILLYHHLALLASRIYVYQPLVWRTRGEHSLVPLSAFLRGPTEGTISAAIFHNVCPPDEIKHVRLYDGISVYADLWDHAIDVLNSNDRCVMVDDWILQWSFLASSAIHSMWPSFRHYLSHQFVWSNAVMHISIRAHSKLNLKNKLNTPNGDEYMAIHFRRGDFEDHCRSLAGNHIGFTTWATLPMLIESTFPPALNLVNESSIIEHCYPELSRILDVIDMHARARPNIRTIHILHDGAWDHPLVYYQRYKLEAALKSSSRALRQGWPAGPIQRITHSGMVPLNWGEADWAVAVDVEIARNAEVFIGNGFSSLSTQVLALRLGADGGRIEDVALL